MGENLAIEGRLSVRTPMQWSDGRNAGFSTARPSRLRRPVPDGRFGPLAINVADQERDPDSLLNWMTRLARRRRETPEFGWGAWSVLDTGDTAVLGHRCDWEGRTVVAIHNLSAEPRELEVRLGDAVEDDELTVRDLLDRETAFEVVGGGRLRLKLEGYGYRWLRLLGPADPLESA